MGSVTFQNCPCSTPRSKEDSVPLPAMANILSVSEDEMSDDTVSESLDNDDYPEPLDSSLPSPGMTSSQKAPYINIISANAFVRALKIEGSRCYSISVHKHLEAKGHSVTKGSDMEGVPKLYHEFSDVFSEAKADTLAPNQEYDLKIEINEIAKTPVGPIYLQCESELGSLRTFIDEHLNIGFIQPSNSPFGAPVLFIKKKDGSLRLCIDFQKLNTITRKDKYPLTLISYLLDALSKAKIFTKIDLKHAYHLVCILLVTNGKQPFGQNMGPLNGSLCLLELPTLQEVFKGFLFLLIF